MSIDLVNVQGAGLPNPMTQTTGTGTVTASAATSTEWVLDDSFEFIELDFSGGSISGNSGANGSASATVTGTSNKLEITNTSGVMQMLQINGTYSANLASNAAEDEFAEVGFSFNIVEDNNGTETILGGEMFKIDDTDSFTANNQAFNIAPLMIAANSTKTVFINSNSSLSGSAFAVAVPEPLTFLGASTAAGFGVLVKRKLAKKKPEKSKL